MPQDKLNPKLTQWVVQALARLALTFSILLGVLIVIGGRIRWSGPSFTEALTYPGAPSSWGWVAVAIGATGLLGSITGRIRVVAAGLFFLAVWCLFFAYSFTQTAITIPEAATTGPAVYFYATVNCAVLAVAHWQSAQRGLPLDARLRDWRA